MIMKHLPIRLLLPNPYYDERRNRNNNSLVHISHSSHNLTAQIQCKLLTIKALLCEERLDPSMTKSFVKGYLREAASSKILRFRSPSGSGSYLLKSGMINTGTIVIMKTLKQNMKIQTYK